MLLHDESQRLSMLHQSGSTHYLWLEVVSDVAVIEQHDLQQQAFLRLVLYWRLLFSFVFQTYDLRPLFCGMLMLVIIVKFRTRFYFLNHARNSFRRSIFSDTAKVNASTCKLYWPIHAHACHTSPCRFLDIPSLCAGSRLRLDTRYPIDTFLGNE
jgi:hypothetical protein